MNVLSAVFNIFSFTLIIPILKILFNLDSSIYSFIAWNDASASFKDKVLNNLYWFVSQSIIDLGAGTVLLILCLILSFMTLLKPPAISVLQP